MSAALTVADLQAWVDRSPYHRWLGLRALALDAAEGVVTLSLPPRPEFARGDSASGIHGGVTAALIDTAGDYAIAVRIGGPVPTIALAVDYLRMGETALTATARVLKAGRSIALVDIDVHDAADRLIAVGRATYATARV